jgi:hypothetical protein
MSRWGNNNGVFIGFKNGTNVVGSLKILNTTGVELASNSDYRLKENVVDTPSLLDNIKKIKVRNYNYINDEDKTTETGFIAHELQEIFPSIVTGEKDAFEDRGDIKDEWGRTSVRDVVEPDPESLVITKKKLNGEGKYVEYKVQHTWTKTKTVPAHQTVSYARLTPMIIKALQESLDLIDNLKQRIEVLENS